MLRVTDHPRVFQGGKHKFIFGVVFGFVKSFPNKNGGSMIQQVKVKQSDIDPAKALLVYDVFRLECERFGTCLLPFDEIAIRAGEEISGGMVSHAMGYLLKRNVIDARASTNEDARKTGARREIYVRTEFSTKTLRAFDTFYRPFPYLYGDRSFLRDAALDHLYGYFVRTVSAGSVVDYLGSIANRTSIRKQYVASSLCILLTHGIIDLEARGDGRELTFESTLSRISDPLLTIKILRPLTDPLPVVSHVYETGEEGLEDLPIFSRSEPEPSKRLADDPKISKAIDALFGSRGTVGKLIESDNVPEVEEDPWSCDLVTGANDLVQLVGADAYVLRRVIRSLVASYGQVLEDGELWIQGSEEFANFGNLFNGVHSTVRAEMLTRLLKNDLVKFTFSNGSFWYRLDSPNRG